VTLGAHAQAGLVGFGSRVEIFRAGWLWMIPNGVFYHRVIILALDMRQVALREV
jgi:hypothetical protein